MFWLIQPLHAQVSAEKSDPLFHSVDSLSGKIEKPGQPIDTSLHSVSDSINKNISVVTDSLSFPDDSSFGKIQKLIPIEAQNLPKLKGVSLPTESVEKLQLPAENIHLPSAAGTLKGQLPEKPLIATPLKEAKQVKAQLDSGNYEALEKKSEALLVEHVDEFKELNALQAEGGLASGLGASKPVEWDPSKVAASQQIAEKLGGHADKIQSALKSMEGMKQKYSKVNLMNPNGPVLTELDKRPVDRWQFGLGLEAKWMNGLLLKSAPLVAYKFTNKWSAGLSGTADILVYHKDSLAAKFNREISYRVFSQYKFYKNIFAHVEFEQPYATKSEEMRENWYDFNPLQPKGWLGLGIEYKIYKKLKGQTQVLYNIVPPDYTKPSKTRWGVRINLIIY
ncbi:hypothetical protein GCM10011506_21010 [Marivirga lumbricoides]|uniref:Outer membrane protein beta-barrel domain-containing protein n=2 Tax=Marivirga lumbricoides TaxID=1046115 RepID=A0ABQ1MAL8_9BACT|nr:hypothetical protein GCM10011506_21010 [Marivirga lumbricoides]